MVNVLSPVHVKGRAELGIRPGDTVRVAQKITEIKRSRGADKKEKATKNTRLQIFEGLVLSVKHGTEPGASFTVRATLSGVGVEKTFPLYSPMIDSIEIVRRSKVRRAKLYFIREKAAKEIRRQLRNARAMGVKSDESIPSVEASDADDTSVELASEESPVEEQKEAVAA